MMLQIVLYALFTLLGISLGCMLASAGEENRTKEAIKRMAKDSRPVMVDGTLYKIEEVNNAK